MAPHDPVRPPSATLTGIGEELPPLSHLDRQRLVIRAEAGNLDAMYALAHHALRKDGPMYYWGSWGDVAEAERWWRRAAELGDPDAMILIGHMYAEPWGVPQNISEAANWFLKAADSNRLDAVQALIDLYLGAWSNERDEFAASHWLERAAAMGDRHAKLLLGLRYDAGWGVRENAQEAATWYARAISGDNTVLPTRDQRIAMNNLGVMYEEGRGVPKDESKAAELYRRASGYPSLRATYNLAVLCETGRGVAQDKQAALWLYREAAIFELPQAAEALKRLGFQPEDQDREAEALLIHDKEKRTKTACDP